MPEIQASRRLVKSPPELWAEVSDAASLARHLGEVGEIRITRLEPETTVAWEGETASGTVALAPAGWGTSVTLTAEPIAAAEPEPADPVAPEPVAPAPEPTATAEPAATTEPAAEPEREPVAAAEPKPEPEAAAEPRTIGIEERSEAEPDPEAIGIEERSEAEPDPTRRGWFARLFRRRIEQTAATEPEPSTTDADRAGGAEDARAPGEDPGCARPEGHRPRSGWSGPARQAVEPQQEPPAAEEPEPKQDPLEAVLTSALDSLGQAHHRPFSRG